MKITKLDVASLRLVQERVSAALKPLEAELGVTITLGRGKYSNSSTGAITLDLACVKPDGATQTAAEVAFRRYAPLVGLKSEDFGREFKHSHERYRIVGYNPKRPKYSILTERSDGKAVCFPADSVRALLALSTARAA